MENNSNQDYGQEGNNSQNEKEKHIGTARLNVDSERRIENLKDDTDQNRYYDNKSDDDDAEKIAGKESSYRSPEDERAFDPENPEKYITRENPDSKEESDTSGVKSPERTPGL